MAYEFTLTAWDGDDAVSIDATDEKQYLDEADVKQMLAEARDALGTKPKGWKIIRTDSDGGNVTLIETAGEDE